MNLVVLCLQSAAAPVSWLTTPFARAAKCTFALRVVGDKTALRNVKSAEISTALIHVLGKRTLASGVAKPFVLLVFAEGVAPPAELFNRAIIVWTSSESERTYSR